MSVTAVAILIYTPFAQFLVAYIWLYRNDLGRVFRGRTEKTGLKAWLSVLRELELIDDTQQPTVRGGGRGEEEWGLPWVVLGTVTAVSWMLVTFVMPVLLPPGTARFATALTAAAQFVPAFVLLAGLSKPWLGELPVAPGTYALKGSRLGSRVRHLEAGGSNSARQANPTVSSGASKWRKVE